MPRSLKALKQEKESLKGVSAGADSGKITVSATQPSDPVEGDEWFDKVNEVAYIAVENDTTSTVEFKSLSQGGGGGITLSDLSITSVDAEPTASFSYNNNSGLFTYTPPSIPDVSGLALSSNVPASLTDLGITDGTNGQLLSTNGSGNFSFAAPALNTGVTVYNTQASMPLTGNSIGDMAFAEDTDRLFLWNNGWYKIQLGSDADNSVGGVVFTYPVRGPSGWAQFTVPSDVTSICVLCIGAGGAGGWETTPDDAPGGGGGALAYANNITVTPGDVIGVTVGRGGLASGGDGGLSEFDRGQQFLVAGGGEGGPFDPATARTTGGAGGVSSGSGRTGGGNGGRGGIGDTANSPGGGGGAGGYSGNGGNGADAGADTNPVAGSNGAGGGGGGGSTENNDAGGGGGVGIYGQGTNGSGGAATTDGSGGGGGSGGANGSDGTASGANGAGGLYGGGGAGGEGAAYTPGGGAHGVVRIIWGNGRSFPSTNVSYADSLGNETTDPDQQR